MLHVVHSGVVVHWSRQIQGLLPGSLWIVQTLNLYKTRSEAAIMSVFRCRGCLHRVHLDRQEGGPVTRGGQHRRQRRRRGARSCLVQGGRPQNAQDGGCAAHAAASWRLPGRAVPPGRRQVWASPASLHTLSVLDLQPLPCTVYMQHYVAVCKVCQTRKALIQCACQGERVFFHR